MKIGTKIASIRKNSKFTQEFLAAKLDRTPQWLSNIERGIRSIDTNALARLAYLFNVRSGDFFETKLNDTCISATNSSMPPQQYNDNANKPTNNEIITQFPN